MARIAAAKGEERRQLVEQRTAHCAEISALKKALQIKKDAREGYGECFVAMAREILSKSQYEIIKNAAMRLYEQRQKALQESEAAETTAITSTERRTS